ncbi:5592_t:CDS:2, partial [Racocetra persica]
RSRSDEEAIMMGKEYRNFVYSLLLDNNIKDLLASDLKINWICDEWRQCFIDDGRAPHIYNLANAKPMTTNNLTKHSLVQNELGETLFNMGLVTYWNMRTIKHKQFPRKKLID